MHCAQTWQNKTGHRHFGSECTVTWRLGSYALVTNCQCLSTDCRPGPPVFTCLNSRRQGANSFFHPRQRHIASIFLKAWNPNWTVTLTEHIPICHAYCVSWSNTCTELTCEQVCSICLNERTQNHEQINKHPHGIYIALHTDSMISNHARTLKHTGSQTYAHICMNQIISLTRKLHIIHTQMHRHILYTRAHVDSFFRGMSTAEGVTDVSSDCHAPGDAGKWERWKGKKRNWG